jgi:hypothetical protein
MTEAESWGSVMILLKGSETSSLLPPMLLLETFIFQLSTIYFCFNNPINSRRIYILNTPVPHSVKRQEPTEIGWQSRSADF